MRNICLCALCFLVFKTYGQTPAGGVVTDPGAYAYLAESVKTGIEVADKANKSLEMLKKAKESIEKVSGAIRTLNMVARLIENQTDIITRTRSIYNDMEKSKKFRPRELANILNNLNYIVIAQQQNIQLALQILENDVFKMNDSERLKLLMELSQSLASCLNDVSMLGNRYARIRNQRTIQNALR